MSIENDKLKQDVMNALDYQRRQNDSLVSKLKNHWLTKGALK